MARQAIREVFVEANPFHGETLYFYQAEAARDEAVVFAHKRLFGHPLVQQIPKQKFRIGWLSFVIFLVRNRPRRCHFNTINVTLTPLTWEVLRLNFTTLMLPVLSRVLGCRNDAIVHEADQFFTTGIYANRRHRWFKNLIGRWYIGLFDRRYVLATEVVDFLEERKVRTVFLDSTPLCKFDVEADAIGEPLPEATSGRVLCWIGPIVGYRRSWDRLLELDPEHLEKSRISIVMLCDGRIGEGPALRAALEARGLARHFIFFDRRPSDHELFAWVRRSSVVLCLYSGSSYGRTKTSGARHIAFAFRKPFIATAPALGVYEFNGSEVIRTETLNDCIEWLAKLPATSPLPLD